MKSTRVVGPGPGPGPASTVGPTGGFGKKSTGTETIRIVESTEDYQEPLRVAVYGEQGVGKSRLGATGPGDIGAIPLDRKAKQTLIATCKAEGKRLFMPSIDLVRVTNPFQTARLKPFCLGDKDGPFTRDMQAVTRELNIFGPQPMCCAIHHYRWHVDRVKHSLAEICAMPNIRTVVIDSGTNLWDDILFANHGRTDQLNPRDRGPDNREMQEILGIVTTQNFVITAKEKEVWKNNKPSGEVTWSGYGHLGYEVSVVLHMKRHPRTGEFSIDVELAQANAALHGAAGEDLLTGDDITFWQLAMQVYPSSDIETWT